MLEEKIETNMNSLGGKKGTERKRERKREVPMYQEIEFRSIDGAAWRL